jgi:hypothetical protein
VRIACAKKKNKKRNVHATRPPPTPKGRRRTCRNPYHGVPRTCTHIACMEATHFCLTAVYIPLVYVYIAALRRPYFPSSSIDDDTRIALHGIHGRTLVTNQPHTRFFLFWYISLVCVRTQARTYTRPPAGLCSAVRCVFAFLLKVKSTEDLRQAGQGHVPTASCIATVSCVCLLLLRASPS